MVQVMLRTVLRTVLLPWGGQEQAGGQPKKLPHVSPACACKADRHAGSARQLALQRQLAGQLALQRQLAGQARLFDGIIYGAKQYHGQGSLRGRNTEGSTRQPQQPALTAPHHPAVSSQQARIAPNAMLRVAHLPSWPAWNAASTRRSAASWASRPAPPGSSVRSRRSTRKSAAEGADPLASSSIPGAHHSVRHVGMHAASMARGQRSQDRSDKPACRFRHSHSHSQTTMTWCSDPKSTWRSIWPCCALRNPPGCHRGCGVGAGDAPPPSTAAASITASVSLNDAAADRCVRAGAPAPPPRLSVPPPEPAAWARALMWR